MPSFVANNYFCETGNPGRTAPLDVVYTNDPLWDGEGCGATSYTIPSYVLLQWVEISAVFNCYMQSCW